MRRSGTALLSFAILAAGLAVAASRARSAESGDSTERASKADRVSGAATPLAANKVGRDPATGALRPTTPQEDEKLAEAIEKAMRKYPPHAVRRRRDGSLSLVAAPQFLSLSVARVSKDGALSLECSGAEAEAARLRAASKRDAAELPKE